MFEALAADVRNLSVPVDSAALVELLALQDQLQARVCEAVGAFDAAELWDLDAATSMHAWLRDRARMSSGQAGRLVGTSRRVRATGRPGSTTSPSSADATTNASTNPAGAPNSCPTPPSKSPTPTAS